MNQSGVSSLGKLGTARRKTEGHAGIKEAERSIPGWRQRRAEGGANGRCPLDWLHCPWHWLYCTISMSTVLPYYDIIMSHSLNTLPSGLH
jgi:hypothetical protein